MSIGSVLALLREDFPDVTISKIRFLEAEGLVTPERAPSGYRRFSQSDCERLRFVQTHRDLLLDANRDPDSRYSAPFAVMHTHVRVLLQAAGSTGDLDAQADALIALLDADYVTHQLAERDRSLDQLGDAWDSVARKLCGT